MWPKTLMMCLTNLAGLVRETKSGFKKNNEWYTKMVEQNNEFCYRKNYKVHGRKIPEATALLAPWTPLPHYALSLASSGSTSSTVFLFPIFLFSIILIFVSQVHHKFSNSREEIKFDDVIFTEKFRCLSCTPQSMNAFLSTTLVIKAFCEMIIINMAQKTLEKILV